MKNFLFVLLMGILISTGCETAKAPKPDTTTPAPTEIVCPGVPARGVVVGAEAYVVLNGPVLSARLLDNPREGKETGSVSHHYRVRVKDGPVCLDSSAWWQVLLPSGHSGWLQIGSALKTGDESYEAILQPFFYDAVQRDVSEEKTKEAHIRYIVADIELGGEDVLQYYKEQAAAKPDDPETEIIQFAMEIINAGNGAPVLANAEAFERKPLRGGTSVVDAGTEYVQPGLDILLLPCDGPDLHDPACQVFTR